MLSLVLPCCCRARLRQVIGVKVAYYQGSQVVAFKALLNSRLCLDPQLFSQANRVVHVQDPHLLVPASKPKVFAVQRSFQYFLLCVQYALMYYKHYLVPFRQRSARPVVSQAVGAVSASPLNYQLLDRNHRVGSQVYRVEEQLGLSSICISAIVLDQIKIPYQVLITISSASVVLVVVLVLRSLLCSGSRLALVIAEGRPIVLCLLLLLLTIFQSLLLDVDPPNQKARLDLPKLQQPSLLNHCRSLDYLSLLDLTPRPECFVRPAFLYYLGFIGFLLAGRIARACVFLSFALPRGVAARAVAAQLFQRIAH